MQLFRLAASFTFKGVGSPKKPMSLVDDSGSKLDNGTDLSTNKSSSVLTFEPYSYSSSRFNRRPRFKGKEDGLVEYSPGTFESVSYAKFLILKMKNGQKMREFDMFSLNREIVGVCEREPKISFLNDGSLLIEVASPEESRRIQSLVSLAGSDVDSMPHKRLNQVRGVIRSVELLRYSEEKIQKELEDQGVIEVKQMKKTVGGLLTPLPTYVLTFQRLKLPNTIRAAWLRLEVRPYIPSCRRCFFCQKYGHVINNCRKKMKGEKSICENCGQEEHGECHNNPNCINCGEGHPASSKKCERFKFEQEVQALRAREHLNFKEARQRVSATYVQPGTLFSSVISRKRPTSDAKVDMPNKPRPDPVSSERVIKTRSSNHKRRLSGEKEESVSSKIHLSNQFSLLDDEVDFTKSNPTLVQPMDQAGLDVSASDVDQAGMSISVSIRDGVEASSSASVPGRAGVSVSVCSREQDGESNLTQANIEKISKICFSGQAEDITPDVHLERADSFVSATSMPDDTLPSLEDKPVSPTEKKGNSSSGTIPKTSVSGIPRPRGLENANRTLQMPNKNKESNNSTAISSKLPKNDTAVANKGRRRSSLGRLNRSSP